MATVETQILDDIIVKSRRKLMTLGASALAGLVIGGSELVKPAEAASYSDADILNFALNLEYLEANFYYMAAYGCTIDKAGTNAAAIAAGAPGSTNTAGGIAINGVVGSSTGNGVTATTAGAGKVPFVTPTIAAYANETAIEEGKHVVFLRSALSSMAVAQPAINIGTVFQALGGLLTPSAPTFNPYTSENNFLLGAYIFEDVGVTAYHGAASLLTVSGNLSAAAGILAVEAYHAGLIRTTISALDPVPSAGSLATTAQSISALRAAVAKSALLGVTPPASAYDTGTDDFGPIPQMVTLEGTTASATTIVDADKTNSIAFGRNVTQILNIVTAGGAVNTAGTAAISPAVGGFFPNGLNKGPNGFN